MSISYPARLNSRRGIAAARRQKFPDRDSSRFRKSKENQPQRSGEFYPDHPQETEPEGRYRREYRAERSDSPIML
ncbi:MAG: hypothetical protein GPJ22_06510 [Microcystis aeruginosa LL13-03]|nr:hypothetical protein [Microcystis aeruginosa SX13-11]NCR16988.1 hypothetical protein [Microcystis aeruginosa LL13-03]